MSEENQEPVMRDFLDQGLCAGDGVVVSVATGRNGRLLALGIVVGFTEKRVRVEFKRKGRTTTDKALFAPEFVIKHEKAEIILALS